MDARMLGVWLVGVVIGAGVEGGPFLEGKVVDEEGRPVAGASVKIWDCLGTCLGGKTVLTDLEGRYVFEKKPFRNYPSLVVSMPGRYEVSRTERGPALSKPDPGEGLENDFPPVLGDGEILEVPPTEARQVDFVLGTPAAALVYLGGKVPEGWEQEVKIRSGKDAKVHRYDVSGGHVSGWDYWNFETLPRKESLHVVVTRRPIVEKSNDRKVTKERERESRNQEITIISPGMRLMDPQRYVVRAKVEEDVATGTSFIVVESLRDAVETERKQELVIADPSLGPPADQALQESARALLTRVEAAARPWNGGIPTEIASYEYDATNAEGEKTHVTIDQNSPSGPAWSDIARIRGTAYMPPLRWLFKQPENVVFYGVEIGEEKAVLHYRLKSRRVFGAGLGVGPSWNGFFTTSFSEGKLVIDPRNATVLEHRMSSGPLGEESVEQFGDYVAVGEGFVPRSLRLQSGEMDLRMTFEVHEGKLWLLSEGKLGEEAKAALMVENVVVNLETAAIEN